MGFYIMSFVQHHPVPLDLVVDAIASILVSKAREPYMKKVHYKNGTKYKGIFLTFLYSADRTP